MKAKKTTSSRRTAAQWAELVKAWRKSGETAEVFATSRGVAAGTLTWWKWRLGVSLEPPSVAEREPMRLVAVHVEPPHARAERQATWEYMTARGDVLRVYPGTPCLDVLDIVRALACRKEEP